MKCEAIRELLTQYLLGDLSKALASEVHTHLDQCDGCRAAAREIEPTLDLLRDALAAPSQVPQKLSRAHRVRIMSARPKQKQRKAMIPPPEFPGRMGRVADWFGKGHFFLARAAILLVLIGIAAGMFLPAVSSSREKARRTSDMSDLSQIGKSIAMYSMDHDEAMPESLEELKPYIGDGDKSFEKVTTSHEGRRYFYRGKGLTAAGPSDEPIAVDVKEKGGNVLYLDGSVTWMNKEDLEKEILPKFQEGELDGRKEDGMKFGPAAESSKKSPLSRLGGKSKRELLKGRTEELEKQLLSLPQATPAPEVPADPVSPGGGGYSYGDAPEPAAEIVRPVPKPSIGFRPYAVEAGKKTESTQAAVEDTLMAEDATGSGLVVQDSSGFAVPVGGVVDPDLFRRTRPKPARKKQRQATRVYDRAKAVQAEEMVTKSFDVMPSVNDKFADISASISSGDDDGFIEMGGGTPGYESGGGNYWEAPPADAEPREEPDDLDLMDFGFGDEEAEVASGKGGKKEGGERAGNGRPVAAPDGRKPQKSTFANDYQAGLDAYVDVAALKRTEDAAWNTENYVDPNSAEGPPGKTRIVAGHMVELPGKGGATAGDKDKEMLDDVVIGATIENGAYVSFQDMFPEKQRRAGPVGDGFVALGGESGSGEAKDELVNISTRQPGVVGKLLETGEAVAGDGNGRIAYLVSNSSGLLDMHTIPDQDERAWSTDISDIDIRRLPDVRGNGVGAGSGEPQSQTDLRDHAFFSDRSERDVRYETVRELAALNQGVQEQWESANLLSYDQGAFLLDRLNVGGPVPEAWGRASAEDTRVDDGKRMRIVNKLENIQIPEIDFRQANVHDVIDFLQEMSVEFDPSSDPEEMKGMNVVLNLQQGGAGAAAESGQADELMGGFGFDDESDVTGLGPMGEAQVPLITFKARDISAADALRIVTEITGLKYRVEGSTVMVVPRDAPDGRIVRNLYDVTPTTAKRLVSLAKDTGPQESDMRSFFRDMGVQWPMGASIKYIPAIGKLLVANTAANITVFEKILVELNPPRRPERKKEEDKPSPRFKAFGVNPFYRACDRPFSTFAIDVDTAAYTLSRNYMQKGLLPPAESVRTEEFVNFFDYGYRAPERGTFKIHTECAPAPFGRGLHLMKIGVKGRRIGREEKKNATLMFVIDTSGSMNTPDRIELVKKSLRMLIEKLAPQDEVAIIQFGSKARLVLDYTPAAEKERILGVVDSMQTTGSTNLEEGMRLAYEVAARGFTVGAVNRVLVMSDGVANLGTGAAEDILAEVAKYRKQGIYCSVFGFGMGTYNDEMLETLANKGDGTYTFIDSEDEARRVFVDDLSATLNTIAADVKIQVEFNPDMVTRYRQLGYENRQLKKEQFRDDTVDAGEVGSGQSVTALYELDLQRSASFAKAAAAREISRQRSASPVIATVRVRYRRTDTGAVEEIERPLRMSELAPSVDDMDCRFRLAACTAEFAEILRASPFVEGSDYEDVARLLRPAALELNTDTRVQELLRMAAGARGMSRAPMGE